MIMKSILPAVLIGAALITPNYSYAVDGYYTPSSVNELQKIQQSGFERSVPSKIQESRQEQEDQKKDEGKAQEHIDKKIQEIDSDASLSGSVENEKMYVTIKEIVFPKSSVFSDEELQNFAAPLMNKTVTIEEINKVIENISKAYVLADYFTSRAYLPEQNINEGTLHIALYEGRVGKITVSNNKWTRSSYVQNRIETKEGDLFKLRALEKQVIGFNNESDVKLNVQIKPGEEQGTTDVEIKTDDKFPFHITGVFDNQGRDNIGVLRGGAILQADSLFGIRDKFATGAYFGSNSQVLFADYNAPVNKKGTRVGGTFSFNHVNFRNGIFDFMGKTFGYTAYVTHPLIKKDKFTLNSYTAANAKLTNTDVEGITLFKTSTFSGTQGVNARWDTKKGIWLTGHYATVGYFDEEFAKNAFFKYEGNAVRLHDFGHGIIGEFRVAGQFSPTKELPWIEQYQTGGLASIRGYSEGVLIGRSGYNATAEIITPIPILPKKIGGKKIGYINPRDMIKFAAFLDQGAIFSDMSGGLPSNQFLISTGAGLRINVTNELMARMYWGFPFVNTIYEADRRMGRFHFELSTRPDLTRIVRMRNKKEVKEVL